MTAREPRSPTFILAKMMLRLTLLLALVGGVFIAYLALIYQVSGEQRAQIVLQVAGAGVIFGCIVLAVSWAFLAPVRRVLGARALGAPLPPHLEELAGRRAAQMPSAGSLLTLAFWILGGVIVRMALDRAGIPEDAAAAGLFAGFCTGMVSGLLFYYLALSDLFGIRAQLPGGPPVRGGSIGLRVQVTSVAILMVGVAMVGVTGYLNFQVAIEDHGAASCARALAALSALDVPASALADAAATSCGGAASVSEGGRVLAAVGRGEELMRLPASGPLGRRLSAPLRSGATLSALVGRDPAAGVGFARKTAPFAFVAIGLALLLAPFASRAITAPVRGLADGAQAVAQGDLSREVPVLAGDELGSLAKSFAAMRGGLRQLIGGISSAASSLNAQVSAVNSAGALVQRGLERRREGVAGVTREMTEMDQSVSAVGRDVDGLSSYVATIGGAIAEFAAALDEVRRHGAELERALVGARGEVQALLGAAEGARGEVAILAEASKSTLVTIGESSRTLRALSDAAAESARVAQRLSAQAADGEQVVEEAVKGVEAIRGVVAEARKRVRALGERSADISGIVDFIAEVAGRTNLLSLNAAIIAAQAGEQGKPFAVVAEHIRELAAQIGRSTKRIADIIAGTRLEVDATSALIQQGDELAVIGVERARESGAALRSLAEQTLRARDVAETITPVVAAHADTARQIEQLASRVVELAEGFAGVELLVRGGRSIDRLAGSLSPLTRQVGKALEEQAGASRKQVESLEEINRMILRLNHTVAHHGEGTARVLKRLSELVALADEDRRAVAELAQAARALTRHASDLRAGLGQFRL